jgi:hypothetical protein
MQKFTPSITIAAFFFFGTFLYVGRWAGGETFLMALIISLLSFALTFMLTSGKTSQHE